MSKTYTPQELHDHFMADAEAYDRRAIKYADQHYSGLAEQSRAVADSFRRQAKLALLIEDELVIDEGIPTLG